MSRKNYGVFALLAVILVSFGIFLVHNTKGFGSGYAQNNQYESTPDFLKAEGEDIIISSQDDWAKYNFQGNGSYSNPFLIANLSIAQIDISNIADSFIIENCTISAGIQISSVKSAFIIVQNNIFLTSGDAINLYNIRTGIFRNNVLTHTLASYSHFGIISSFCEGLSIVNNTINFFDTAIYLSSTSETYVVNNTIGDNSLGILGRSVNSCLFINNYFNSSIDHAAIQLENSYDVVCQSNDITSSGSYAVYLFSCYNISFIENFVHDTATFETYQSPLLTFIGNTFYNIVYGVRLSGGDNIAINNTFVNASFSFADIDAIQLSSWTSSYQRLFSVFQNNTINDQTILYIAGTSGKTLTELNTSQIILEDVSNVIISDSHFNSAPLTVIISNSNTINIRNCIFDSLFQGLAVIKSSSILLEDNHFEGMNFSVLSLVSTLTYKQNNFERIYDCAILIEYGQEIEIYNNTFLNVKTAISNSLTNIYVANNIFFNVSLAIELEETYYFSISSNYFDSCSGGIYEKDAFGFTNASKITYNTFYSMRDFAINSSGTAETIISNNNISVSEVGVFLSSAYTVALLDNFVTKTYIGFYILRGSENVLMNNTLSYNHVGVFAYNTRKLKEQGDLYQYNHVGLMLNATSQAIIKLCTFKLNEYYAIIISSSSHENTIFLNSFIDNNFAGTSQCYDDSDDSLWYDPVSQQGNYWSDRTSRHYSIDGAGKAKDIHPLNAPPNSTQTSSSPVYIFFVLFALIIIAFRRNISTKLLY
ncbi:MAG: NosD domain-containing protein [Candidatus Heimdallarchaeaceae archaeon]